MIALAWYLTGAHFDDFDSHIGVEVMNRRLTKLEIQQAKQMADENIKNLTAAMGK